MPKKTVSTITRVVLYMWLFLSVLNFANAQNPPKIQQVSLRAPANIKIDGKITEWDNKLQAYNRTDELWYTISNDDDNLYLTVLAPNGIATDKFFICGLTFTISHSVKKRVADNVAIIYPLLNGSSGNNILMSSHAYADLAKDSLTNRAKMDSVVKAGNTKVGKGIKEIQVTGIKEIDSVISVYNTEGVRVAGQFDKRMNFVFELAVPLKYLGFSANEASKFSYNIQLNGFPAPKVKEIDRLGRPIGALTDNPPPPGANPKMVYLNWPVDFWGEYTLAKK